MLAPALLSRPSGPRVLAVARANSSTGSKANPSQAEGQYSTGHSTGMIWRVTLTHCKFFILILSKKSEEKVEYSSAQQLACWLAG